ncbi:MAG: LysR family transcriptional regulator [Acidobacteriota bacterium]|nr:LysR family transcriptional regulator [Acidobacteriota bacterium]
MEMRQLRYLVALAQELSFTGAAARANVAQPALSRQIRKLEDELGTALVDRTSRRVQMTATGRRLAERALLILDEVDAARSEIREVTELASGRLAIAATQTTGPLHIARLLHEFHTLHPGIELAVREELSLTIADRLRCDEVDLGFVAEIPDQLRQGLTLRRIAAEPLVVALPAGHPLAGAGEVGFQELQAEPFILFPEGATIRSTVERLAAAHGVQPQIAFVTSDTDRMRELVALGLGISLLPQSDVTRPGQEHSMVRIRGHELTYSVYLARRSNRRQPPAAVAMAELVESLFATQVQAGATMGSADQPVR